MLESEVSLGQPSMDFSAPKTKFARFGLFEADFEQHVLTREGRRLKLQDQPFQVLALLLERPGEIVTRDEIRQKLWSADTYVEFDDGLNTAIKKLRFALGDAADNPRYIETIPRRGYRFLAPVTLPVSDDPSESTKPPEAPTTNIVIAAQERSRLVIEHASSRSTLLWGTVAMTLVLVAGAAGYFYRVGQRSRPRAQGLEAATTNAAIKPRLSVGVMGFRNLSPSPQEAWLSTALSEMLNTELAAGERVRMVPGEQVSRAKLDLSLADTEAMAKESLARVRSNIGADYVVLGSYMVVGERGKGRIRLDLRLQDARVGETIAEESVNGNEGELFELVSLAGSRLRSRLGIADPSSQEAVGLRASLPAGTQAARLYAEGLSRLRVFDGLGARDALLKAIAADPKCSLAHSALAETWTILGYDDRAKEEGKRAFDLSDGLSRPDRLFLEGTYHQTTKEWSRAIEIYTTLFDSYTDNPDYGLHLASSLTAAGKPNEAIVVLDKLNKLPLSAEDPRIDISRSRALLAAGALKQSQSMAEAAAEKARRSGSRLLLAEALDCEAGALLDLGDLDRAIAIASEEQQIYTSVGNKFGVAAALSVVGSAQWYQGNMREAVHTFESARQVDKEVGNRRGSVEALSYIGAGLAEKGDLVGARKAFEEAIVISREINAKAGAAGALSEVAWTYLSEGNLSKARAFYEETVEMYRSTGSRAGECAALEQLGLLLVTQGDLTRAETILGQALEIARQTGDKIVTGNIFRNQGILAFMQGDMARARKEFTDALQLAADSASGGTGTVFLKMWIAKIDIAEGHAIEAESSLRGVRQEFRKAHELGPDAQASALLIEALLAQDKHAEAEKEAESSRDLVRRCPFFDESLQLKIVLARVTAAHGRILVARHDLTEALALAKSHGFPEDEFLAALSLGELEMHSNNVSVGRGHLQTLEKSATARGFLLFARKASSAASRQ